MEDKFHCYECGGQAKRKGEDCFTCDGEGNPKVVISKPIVKPVKPEVALKKPKK